MVLVKLQTAFRKLTSRLRQKPHPVTDASSGAGITWVVVRRTLLWAVGVGGFLSFVQAFGTGNIPLLPRTAYMIAFGCVGAALGIASFRLVQSQAWTQGRLNLQAAVGGALMTPPMSLISWGSSWLSPTGGAPVEHLPGYFLVSLIMCEVMTFVAVYVNRSQQVAGKPIPQPPKFLARLPVRLRSAAIWAVEAQDHYLQVHTARGKELILLRLADAIAELEGLEGAQVHRSWWVSRAAIVDARRGEGRATLTLPDGTEVPVSRTYAKALRQSGWI